MRKIFLGVIRIYQKTAFIRKNIIQTLYLNNTGKTCRFSPTCSEYTYLAFKRYGIVKGIVLGLKRILKCHPWSKGGYDPIPNF